MASALNSEFFTLLETLNSNQSFTFNLSPTYVENEGIVCSPCESKQLTTANLKQLIESVVSNPLDVSVFGTASIQVFESCIKTQAENLNILDKQLFLLSSRIHSLSPVYKYTKDEQVVEIDLNSVYANLQQSLLDNFQQAVQDQVTTEGNLTIIYGIPLIKDEKLLYKEFYTDYKIDVNDPASFKQKIGEAFLQEITKCVRSVTINSTSVLFKDLSFAERIQLVENLPSIAVQPIIKYIEKYKTLVEENLTIDGHVLSLDSSFFTLK